MNIKEFLIKNIIKNKKNVLISSGALALTIALTSYTGHEFKQFSNYVVDFYADKNPNVTEVLKFSDFSPNIKGTSGDADIFVLKGTEDGPSILILGGTHPNEPSGQLTATLLLDNLKVNKGTVYIVTETNRSAFTHSYPQEGSPFYYTLSGTRVTGTRTFKYGSRATNTNDQWPNPDIYVHEYTGQKLSTSETRNLNRAYPGLENGTYTEQVAYAITKLIQEKDICITVDLHEASPEYKTINTFICGENTFNAQDGAMSLANNVSKAILGNEYWNGEEIGVEPAANNLHGLSHIELTDHTNTLAMIMETSNASQGKYRGAFTTGTILYEKNSKDVYYEYIANLEDKDINPKTDDGSLYARPACIEERVARHSSAIAELIYQYNYRLFGKTDTPTPNMDKFREFFDVDNGKYDFIDKRYSTKDELISARIAMGKFDVDFSGITNDATLSSKNVSKVVYSQIYNNSIGSFLY